MLLLKNEKGETLAELERERTTIGRDPSNELVLEDPSVSGFHAVVLNDRGAVSIVDLGSTNGTAMDGKRLRERTALKAWCRLQLGGVKLVVGRYGISGAYPGSAGGSGSRPGRPPRRHRAADPGQVCRPGGDTGSPPAATCRRHSIRVPAVGRGRNQGQSGATGQPTATQPATPQPAADDGPGKQSTACNRQPLRPHRRLSQGAGVAAVFVSGAVFVVRCSGSVSA